MPIASFSGLASGIDSTTLVNGLVGIARQPITRLQIDQSTLSLQAARIDDLSGKLSALRSSVRALDTSADVLSTKAKSADESVIKARIALEPARPFS